MLLRLKRRADSFDNWATEVKRALDPSDHKVGELKCLMLLKIIIIITVVCTHICVTTMDDLFWYSLLVSVLGW